MFCKNCGREIPDDSVICAYCGVKIHDDNIQTYQQQGMTYQQPGVPFQQPNTPYPNTYNPYMAAANTAAVKKKSNTGIIVFLMILVVVIAAIIIAAVFSSGDDKNSSSSSKEKSVSSSANDIVIPDDPVEPAGSGDPEDTSPSVKEFSNSYYRFEYDENKWELTSDGSYTELISADKHNLTEIDIDIDDDLIYPGDSFNAYYEDIKELYSDMEDTELLSADIVDLNGYEAFELILDYPEWEKRLDIVLLSDGSGKVILLSAYVPYESWDEMVNEFASILVAIEFV